MSQGRPALPLLLVLVVALSSTVARAAHFSGGSISYACVGGNFYQITLDLFVDCSGAALQPQNLILNNDCGVSFAVNNVPLVLTEEVSQLCSASLASSTCNGGFLQGIRHYRFVTTVYLSPCNDWTIGWENCDRNVTQNVLGAPCMYFEATVNNAGGVCDASPVPADNSIPFVCVNQPVSYNPGFTDPDGNTMQFALVPGLFLVSTSPHQAASISYRPGFSPAEPIPGITLDPTNGQLSFTPTVTGNYIVVMEVTTFNSSGVPIGRVMRDFLIVVQNCATSPPVTTGLTNGSNAFIASAGAVEVCDGIPFCVDIPFTDADPGSVITLTSNAAALLPGATLTVTGTNPAVGRLCWTPDPAYSPANIQVQAEDNSCPISNRASAAILVTVVQPPAVPPNAGNNGTLSACLGSPPTALFPALGGSPQLGGVWTDPNGVVHDGTFTPPGDPFGVYTYTVGNGCQRATATVTVSATGGQNPGTDGTLTLCSNAAPVGLTTGLGGSPQAGGTWSPAAPGGMYDPATMAPGAYVYTVPGVAPCPPASATVTVTRAAAPNPGTSGTLTLCSTSTPVALSTGLGGTPAIGGTWTDQSAATIASGIYDPATMASGVYTYTVTGTAPCTNATATVTVTENAVP
ncbi:MAG: hypothetical protein KF797_12820, partial [Flavobacteriales bacterium]|nr:hypothetical protein [Flavobacteriales bacterium]